MPLVMEGHGELPCARDFAFRKRMCLKYRRWAHPKWLHILSTPNLEIVWAVSSGDTDLSKQLIIQWHILADRYPLWRVHYLSRVGSLSWRWQKPGWLFQRGKPHHRQGLGGGGFSDHAELFSGASKLLNFSPPITWFRVLIVNRTAPFTFAFDFVSQNIK